MDSRISTAGLTCLWVIISVGILAYALWRAYCLLSMLVSSGKWATGRITKREASLFNFVLFPLQLSSDDQWDAEVAMYEFTTETGERYTGGSYFFTYWSPWNPSRNQGPQTGDIVRIIYLKDNPAVNMTKSSIANKLWGAFLIAASDTYWLMNMNWQ